MDGLRGYYAKLNKYVKICNILRLQYMEIKELNELEI